MHWCECTGRSVLSLSGQDVKPFLQGLLTIDVVKLEADRPRYALLLSPQGKYLFDFFLIARGPALWLDSANAAALSALLTRYRLRAAVTIAREEEAAVFAAWGDALPSARDTLVSFPDPRLFALGFRLIGPRDEARRFLSKNGQEMPEDAYDAMRLRLAVPEGGSELMRERSLPLEWRMDALEAIDFDKGCYMGQEVTARMHFRAHVRKQPFAVTAQGGLPPPGTKILAGEKELGEMRSSREGHGIALLNAELLESVSQSPITSGGIPLEIQAPVWALSAKSAG